MDTKTRLKRYYMMLRIFLYADGYDRGKYLKMNKYFKKQGEHCYFQPWNFGTEPHLISFGDNVHVTSDVRFITHDNTAKMFAYMDHVDEYQYRYGEIKIGDNVFIGARTNILYDVKIGNNVIIGAGSLVNKDIPDNCIAGGVPARILGNFDDYHRRIKEINSLNN